MHRAPIVLIAASTMVVIGCRSDRDSASASDSTVTRPAVVGSTQPPTGKHCPVPPSGLLTVSEDSIGYLRVDTPALALLTACPDAFEDILADWEEPVPAMRFPFVGAAVLAWFNREAIGPDARPDGWVVQGDSVQLTARLRLPAAWQAVRAAYEPLDITVDEDGVFARPCAAPNLLLYLTGVPDSVLDEFRGPSPDLDWIPNTARVVKVSVLTGTNRQRPGEVLGSCFTERALPN